MNKNMMLIALLVGALFFLRRGAPTETERLAQQAGVPTEGFWDRPASQTGAWY